MLHVRSDDDPKLEHDLRIMHQKLDRYYYLTDHSYNETIIFTLFNDNSERPQGNK